MPESPPPLLISTCWLWQRAARWPHAAVCSGSAARSEPLIAAATCGKLAFLAAIARL